VVGQRKGPSGANAPPVHGIKKCLVESFAVIHLRGVSTNNYISILFSYYIHSTEIATSMRKLDFHILFPKKVHAISIVRIWKKIPST
jgi:hypothetical protein